MAKPRSTTRRRPSPKPAPVPPTPEPVNTMSPEPAACAVGLREMLDRLSPQSRAVELTREIESVTKELGDLRQSLSRSRGDLEDLKVRIHNTELRIAENQLNGQQLRHELEKELSVPSAVGQ